MRTLYLASILLCITMSSCVHNSYFLSPFHANNHPYRAIPMVSDSTKSAVYASTMMNIGSANQDIRDLVFNFQGSIHQAHTLDHFQFFYGANFSLGNYHVAAVNNNDYTYNDPDPDFASRGNHFFGGVGAFAGADLVIPIRTTGSEWRIIGIETNYQREFGDYLSFRKNLPDSVATAIFRDPYFHTIGLTSNAIKKFRRSGNSLGYKFGIYISTKRGYETPVPDQPRFGILPTYASNTLHFTKQRVTGFVQINIGNYAVNFQTGVNVRLGDYK